MTRKAEITSQPKNETGQRGYSDEDEPEPNEDEYDFIEQVHRKDALDSVSVDVP